MNTHVRVSAQVLDAPIRWLLALPDAWAALSQDERMSLSALLPPTPTGVSADPCQVAATATESSSAVGRAALEFQARFI
jgi:hypothetical protein